MKKAILIGLILMFSILVIGCKERSGDVDYFARQKLTDSDGIKRELVSPEEKVKSVETDNEAKAILDDTPVTVTDEEPAELTTFVVDREEEASDCMLKICIAGTVVDSACHTDMPLYEETVYTGDFNATICDCVTTVNSTKCFQCLNATHCTA
ncbi:hypothetical protein ACFL0V_02070 [Nanoarchaeota archaeon]